MIIGKDQLTLITLDEGVIDSNGDFTQGGRTESDPIFCDAVPSKGEAAVISFEDGKKAHYSYEITLDVDCPDFIFGDTIKLSVSGHSPREYSVLGFHRYQFQAKLWV